MIKNFTIDWWWGSQAENNLTHTGHKQWWKSEPKAEGLSYMEGYDSILIDFITHRNNDREKSKRGRACFRKEKAEGKIMRKMQ